MEFAPTGRKLHARAKSLFYLFILVQHARVIHAQLDDNLCLGVRLLFYYYCGIVFEGPPQTRGYIMCIWLISIQSITCQYIIYLFVL
jgi:hypothetical protein